MYHDVRKFGRIQIFDKDECYFNEPLTKLGYEPFNSLISDEYLFNKLQKFKGSIKEALLDQSIMVGLGNIYCDEVLFSTGILPSTRAIDVPFYKCRSLTNIVLPDSLTYIGGSAFAYTNLKSIDIPDGVTTIGYYAFEHCYNMTSIVIPDSVITIGYYAFYGCTSLTDVYYTGTEEQWYSLSIGDEPFISSATIHFNYVPDAE
jgi:hypothetical protein